MEDITIDLLSEIFCGPENAEFDCQEGFDAFVAAVGARLGRVLSEAEQDWIFSNFDPIALGLSEECDVLVGAEAFDFVDSLLSKGN